jgi:hypothetical protein
MIASEFQKSTKQEHKVGFMKFIMIQIGQLHPEFPDKKACIVALAA